MTELRRDTGLRGDRGSIIPLVLGCFLLAFVLVAGGVAAGDAFVQQSDLQSACDAAAVAGADVASLPDSRGSAGGGTGADQSDVAAAAVLPLGDVQQAVQAYVARDAQLADLQVQAQVAPDGASVEVDCAIHESVTFGAVFGLGGGITHRTSASARAPLS
jgi:Flp pilus assembly protein TadG